MPVNGWGAAGTFGGSQPPIRTAAIDRLGSAPDPSRRCARRDAFAGSDAFTRAGSGFTGAGQAAPATRAPAFVRVSGPSLERPAVTASRRERPSAPTANEMRFSP